MSHLKDIIDGMRCRQWIKNLLVFLPAMAGHQLDAATLVHSTQAFFAFCFCASAIYLVNDLVDIQHDRQCTYKSNRAIASGRLNSKLAMLISLCSLIVGLLLAYSISTAVVLLLSTYVVLTLAYTSVIKKIEILDVVFLSLFYVFRVIIGSAAATIHLSSWLIAFCGFFFFSMALIKRLSEFSNNMEFSGNSAAGRSYEASDVSILRVLAATSGLISVLVLALYIENQNVSSLYVHPEFLWAVCVNLLYWISHILLMANRGLIRGDPITWAMHDRSSLVAALMILSSFLLATANI